MYTADKKRERILILGAAGRDFHNFNVFFRSRPQFEVVGFTADGKGVELAGVLQPITLYLPISDLRQSFVRLERRRDPE